MASRRTLLLFLDGVGVGDADPETNPFFRARLPVIRGLFGGGLPHLDAPALLGPGARTFPLDARLGVEGTPQSGTGQITLLTGRNAPEIYGRHFGPWPPVRLRPLLEAENVLTRALEGGARALFANAYPEGYPEGLSSRRVAAPPLAALGAGLLNRHHEALARGEAIASEIVNDGWIRHLGLEDLPRVEPRSAGHNLARLTREADLTLFAHYHTDTAGHRGGMEGGVVALERVDDFLGGLLDEAPDDLLIVLASDHGNVEDVTRGHTLNPALGMVIGDGAEALGGLARLTDVAPAILGRVLD
jgi:2,3-bisphosphoglycerate-independent phosphoglycerate mutase